MKKVFQTICDGQKGNCMQAAFASLFEVELDEVPNFIEYSEQEWPDVFDRFVRDLGYEYTGFFEPPDHPNDPKFDNMNVDGFFYACVPSKNFDGVGHAVLINRNGMVAHDPNPPNMKSWHGKNIVESQEILYFYGIRKTN